MTVLIITELRITKNKIQAHKTAWKLSKHCTYKEK